MEPWKSELWGGEEIQVGDDGFLLVSDNNLDEEQPLLLHSTEVLLKLLYPSFTKKSFSDHVGYLFDDEDDDDDEEDEDEEDEGNNNDEGVENNNNNNNNNEEEISHHDDGHVVNDNEQGEGDDENRKVGGGDDSAKAETSNNHKDCMDKEREKELEQVTQIPKKYELYQKMKKVTSLGDRMISALLDIQYSRHRLHKVKDQDRLSREEIQIRALEHQQESFLSKQSENSNNEMNDDKNSIDNDMSSLNNEDHKDGGDDHHDVEEDHDSDKTWRERNCLRMVRTLNSIRALMPHIIPILVHKRKNDKKLFIGKHRLKEKKKKAPCWLLGSEVFDTTSNKCRLTLQKDVQIILRAYINDDIAPMIANDPQGSPEFWSHSWVLYAHSRTVPPPIVNPLEILSKGDKGYYDTVHRNTMSLDCNFFLPNENDSAELKSKYIMAINRLHERLSKLLAIRFPESRLHMYGSCLSDLSLGKGSDVDLSLWLPEAARLQEEFEKGWIDANKYGKEKKRFVYQACRKLEALTDEFRNMQPVAKARVPVVKGIYTKADNPYSPDGSINFDICFLNDIAVANSKLLREYSIVDRRVKELMLAVKRWTKLHRINSASDNHISSYTWMNMVIFYLQCIGFVPNLQCPDLMAKVGFTPDPKGNYWHSVNGLDTFALTWDEVRNSNAWQQSPALEVTATTALLYGFFEFYAKRFPYPFYVVSIKSGNIKMSKLGRRKRNLFFCIEDPFETFDSHISHDLGMHAGEPGIKAIMTCLCEAESHLRQLIEKQIESDSLWPIPPFEEPKPPRQQNKNPQYVRFEQKGSSSKQKANNDKKDQQVSTKNNYGKDDGNNVIANSHQEAGQPTNQRQNRFRGKKSQIQGNQSPARGKPNSNSSNNNKNDNTTTNARGRSMTRRNKGNNNNNSNTGGRGPPKAKQATQKAGDTMQQHQQKKQSAANVATSNSAASTGANNDKPKNNKNNAESNAAGAAAKKNTKQKQQQRPGPNNSNRRRNNNRGRGYAGRGGGQKSVPQVQQTEK